MDRGSLQYDKTKYGNMLMDKNQHLRQFHQIRTPACCKQFGRPNPKKAQPKIKQSKGN